MLLQLDPLRILFQAINFLILVFLLYRLLFRPVVAAVRQRRAEVRQLIEDAERERSEAETLRHELEERRQQAEAEADEIVAEARTQAEEERQAIVGAAQEEAEQIIAEARTQARRERQRIISEHYEAILNVILDVSGRVIGRVVPNETHDALVMHLSDRIYELGRESMGEVEAFRRSLGDREPDALVTTARPLSQEQQGQLVRTLTALADRHVNFRIEQDPELIAGLQVRMGDLVIENSVEGELHRLQDAVAQVFEEQFEGQSANE
jgi:F-type H+-transporting ATPase subunit b